MKDNYIFWNKTKQSKWEWWSYFTILYTSIKKTGFWCLLLSSIHVASCICVGGKGGVSDPQKWISGTSENIGPHFENCWHMGKRIMIMNTWLRNHLKLDLLVHRLVNCFHRKIAVKKKIILWSWFSCIASRMFFSTHSCIHITQVNFANHLASS